MDVDVNIAILLSVVVCASLLASLSWSILSTLMQRFLALGFISGSLIYNGFGASYNNVPVSYAVRYVVLISAFLAAYYMALALLSGSMNTSKSGAFYNSFVYLDARLAIICFYIILSIFDLVYPDFRLLDLFNPKGPDLRMSLEHRYLVQQSDGLTKVKDYIILFILPFFYLSLSVYSGSQAWKAILILVFLSYVSYVKESYLGRGDMLSILFVLLYAFYIENPLKRKVIAIVFFACAPLILYFANIYSIVRLGGDIYFDDFISSITKTIISETSFAEHAGQAIIDSPYRADFSKYLLWIATLPLPKIITGPFDVALINLEISQALTGIMPGEKGFFILLAGLVGESVYLYGDYLFFLHGASIGVFAAFVIFFFDRGYNYRFLQGFIIYGFFYYLVRGGVCSLLPLYLNSFLLYYLLFFFRDSRGAAAKVIQR